MGRAATLIAFLVIAFAASPAAAGDAERMSMPGARVSIVPPAGFALSEDGSRLRHATGESSIVLRECPSDLTGVSEAMADPQRYAEAFERIGLSLIGAVERVELDNVDFLLMEISDGQTGLIIDTWTALTESCDLIMFLQARTDSEPLINRAAVLEVMSSLEVAPAPPFEEQAATLGFTIESRPPFDFVDVSLSKLIVLSAVEDRFDDNRAPAILVAAVSTDGRTLKQLAAYLAEGEETIESSEAVNFVGAQGLRQQGMLEAEGTTWRFVRYVAVVAGSAVLLSASGEAQQMDADVIAAADEIALGLRWQPVMSDTVQ